MTYREPSFIFEKIKIFNMVFFLAFPWGTYNKMHVLRTYVRLIWLKVFLFLPFNHAYMHVNYNFKWVKIRVQVFIFYIVLLLVSIHDHKKSNTIKCVTVHINKVIKMGENPENTLVLIYFQKLYKIQNRQRQYNNNVIQRFAFFLKNVIYCTTLDYMKYI